MEDEVLKKLLDGQEEFKVKMLNAKELYLSAQVDYDRISKVVEVYKSGKLLDPNTTIITVYDYAQKPKTIEEIILDVFKLGAKTSTTEIYERVVSINPNVDKSSMNAALSRMADPTKPEYALIRIKKGHYYRPNNREELFNLADKSQQKENQNDDET